MHTTFNTRLHGFRRHWHVTVRCLLAAQVEVVL